MAPPFGLSDLRPSQSYVSVVVDLAAIAALVFLAVRNVHEPVVWSILSGLIAGRFGVSHAKTIERVSGGGGGPPSGGGGGGVETYRGSTPTMRAVQVPETPPRDPKSFPRQALAFLRPALSIVTALVLVLALATVALAR